MVSIKNLFENDDVKTIEKRHKEKTNFNRIKK